MSIEAMKQALEALEDCYSTGGDNGQPLYQFYDDGLVKAAITSLRTAIEQAEKRWSEFNETTKRNIEHAEWYLSTHPAPEQSTQGCPHTTLGTSCLNHDNTPARWGCVMCGKEFIPKPAAQRQWVGLTDEEVFSIADQHPVEGFDPDIMAYTRAIEAKLRERNGGQA